MHSTPYFLGKPILRDVDGVDVLDMVCGWAYDSFLWALNSGDFSMGKAEKSWEKRLSGGPDELAVDFVESLSVDTRLYKYDIVGSIAHAEMLAEQKLISRGELKAIKGGLFEISEEIGAGRFEFRKEYEDIHHRLIEIGISLKLPSFTRDEFVKIISFHSLIFL